MLPQPESIGGTAQVSTVWIPGGSFRMGSDAFYPRQPQMIDTGMNHVGFRCVTREGSDA